jgi:hypothetical protein
MRNFTKLFLLLPFAAVSTAQAATTFLEGSRDSVPIHPSCREENTGLTAVGVALPVGPTIKVTIGKEDTSTLATLPYPAALISTDRKGNVFNANPIMGASPSFNKAALFGMDTVKGMVAPYGSKSKTEDTKTVIWKLKDVNLYDIETKEMSTSPYIPAGGFVTVEMGFALPKFAPESCIVMMKVQGAQFARCDEIDPVTKSIKAGGEIDLRQKRMRLNVERDLEKNPLPANCGEGLTVTVEPTDEEVEAIKTLMNAM